MADACPPSKRYLANLRKWFQFLSFHQSELEDEKHEMLETRIQMWLRT